MRSETVKLNILTTYPVKWTVNSVMRDFIQNFYDSIGYEKFSEGFKYKYKSEVLTMEGDSSFDFDWLCYLGTSTKRTSGKHTAGKFGEGFKVASLVAYRDYGYSITMESKDWRLKVTEEDEEIDGKRVKCLAYKKTKRKDDGSSRLILRNVTQEHFDDFKTSIKGFFYNDNPVLGRCIYFNRGYGVYERSGSKNGIVFAQYQDRYHIDDFPFVITNREYEPSRDDRDRSEFRGSEAGKCVLETISKMTDDSAYDFLVHLRKHWSYNRKYQAFDIGSVIDALIYKVSKSKKRCEDFVEQFGEEIVADFPYGVNPGRRKVAAFWYARWSGKNNRKIVRRRFSDMGVSDVIRLCEEEGGFEQERASNERERRYISVLEKIARTEFYDLIIYDRLPGVGIILNEAAVAAGMAGSVKSTENAKNKYGMMVKYDILRICIKSNHLNRDTFPTALSTYLHELLHQYGKDSERNFHMALILMDVRLSQMEAQLNKYEEEWRGLED